MTVHTHSYPYLVVQYILAAQLVQWIQAAQEDPLQTNQLECLNFIMHK